MDSLKQKKSAVADLIRKAESYIFGNNEDEALILLEKAFEICQKIMIQFPDEIQSEFALIRISALTKLCKTRKNAELAPDDAELPRVALALLNKIRALMLANSREKASSEMKSFLQRFPETIIGRPDVLSLCHQLDIKF
jgi:hypothetical protein